MNTHYAAPSPAFGTPAEWTVFQLGALDGLLSAATRCNVGAGCECCPPLAADISRTIWRILLPGTTEKALGEVR